MPIAWPPHHFSSFPFFRHQSYDVKKESDLEVSGGTPCLHLSLLRTIYFQFKCLMDVIQVLSLSLHSSQFQEHSKRITKIF